MILFNIQNVGYFGLILFLIFSFYTIFQIINKIKIHKYRIELTDKIILLLKSNTTKQEIIQKLQQEGYSEDSINKKITEIELVIKSIKPNSSKIIQKSQVNKD